MEEKSKHFSQIQLELPDSMNFVKVLKWHHPVDLAHSDTNWSPCIAQVESADIWVCQRSCLG